MHRSKWRSFFWMTFGGAIRSGTLTAAKTRRPVNSLPAGASLARSARRSEALQLFQPLQGCLLPQQAIIDATRIQRAALLVRKLIEIGEELLDLRLHRHKQPNVPGQEVDSTTAFFEPSFIGIHTQIGDQRPSRCLAHSCCNVAFRRRKAELPIIPT